MKSYEKLHTHNLLVTKGRFFFRPFYLIILILVLLILAPLSLHFFLTQVTQSSTQYLNDHKVTSSEDIVAKLSGITCESLKSRIDELLKIKASVSNELRDFEQKRQGLQDSISVATSRMETLHQEESRINIELQRLNMSVQQAKLIQKELYEKNMPEINAPRLIKASKENNILLPFPSLSEVTQCRMFNCFDHSRCSILSGFPVYVYDTEKHKIRFNDYEFFVKTTVRQAFQYNPHITDNPDEACLFVVLVGESVGSNSDKDILEKNFRQLPYWNGDGRNHVLLNFARSLNVKEIFNNINTGRAMIVQSHFRTFDLRAQFDILVPPLLGLPGGDLWHDLPPLVPAIRKYFLSFQGELPMLKNYMDKNRQKDSSLMEELNVIQELDKLTHTTTSDKFYLQFSCRGGESFGESTEWLVCGNEDQRSSILKISTFSLIITSPSDMYSSTSSLQARLFECLKYGAIPVILGENVLLPFDEMLDWNRAVIILPKARTAELHYFLRTISNADLLAMRRQSRMIWEKYFGSTQAVFDTILAVIRHRLHIPPLSASEEPSLSVFNETFTPMKTDSIIFEPDTDENLGPIEPPFPSIKYKRNYSISLTGRYETWNDYGDPFWLYPHLPSDPILPSEAKFVGSQVGFRPINEGAGGAGKEFSESLGGNVPREQFTVVMLTYEREQELMNSLSRFYGLPYLNKVIVVWNSPNPPADNLKWPDLKVPIKVIRAKKNSLNNRFLPYSDIETEAILSVDDDAHLRHDEIVFGFRVWREERSRLVGFPGRFHAWDLNHGGWLYNSNYSCQLSMVLTGAAFFHKYYAYMYSQVMPQAIRDKVDEYMNCEDIAMNYLVSHLTRKPPVKVTSRWTFRCPGCPVTLSDDDSHFNERHKCVNFFSQVFGYNPLLYTQFRVDSVLFKTRLPQDKQKCFRFI